MVDQSVSGPRRPQKTLIEWEGVGVPNKLLTYFYMKFFLEFSS